MKKVKVIDIDGIITKEVDGHTNEIYKKRTPINYNIETLKDFRRRGFYIKLHTARFPEDREITLEWLKKHNVPFDELILGKPQADNYYDDKASNQLDREVLCFSGGVDSLIAYHFLDKPQAIYVMMNHRYQQKEIACIEKLQTIIKDLNVNYVMGPDLHNFEEGDKAYISQRNLHLALLASHYGNKIYMVGIKGDNVSDKTPQAYNTMTYAMNAIRKETEPKIEVTSPFWKMTKSEIIRWFLDNYNKEYCLSVLRTSVSCYDNAILESCGKCSCCFRKWISLEHEDIKSYDWFETDIRKWIGIKDYVNKMKKGEYEIQRVNETKKVLEKYNLW